MIVWELKLFGLLPLLAIERTTYECVEEEEEEEDASRIEAGSAHNFERDFDPLSPTSHHEWEWEDKGRFGFR